MLTGNKNINEIPTEHRCRLLRKKVLHLKVAQFKINTSHEKVNSTKEAGTTNYKPQNAM